MTLAGSSATEPADVRPGVPATVHAAEAWAPSPVVGLPPAGVRSPVVGSPSGAAPPVRLGPSAAGRCRRRVHLDADPTAARSLRSAPDDGLRLRLADGVEHRDNVLALLRSALGGEPATTWDPAGPDRPAVIFEPVLRSGSRFGNPDLLIWAGDGYRPVIIRSHRTTDPGGGAITSTLEQPLLAGVDVRRKARAHPADQLALAHHHRLLTDLGLAGHLAVGGVIGRGGLPVVGGVPGAAAAAVDGPRTRVAGDDGGVILWHRLDLPGAPVLADYDVRFADRLAVATAAANGETPLAAPSRIGECRRCPWWPVCSAELLAARDISLISAGGDVDVLHAIGVRTVDDLAAIDAEVASAVPLTGIPPGTARVRARAWLAGWPLVRRSESVDVRRADLELDVDMESFLEDGAYLWGTYLTGPGLSTLGLTGGYRSFVSWQPLPTADEGRAFAAFWTYLRGLRAAAADQGLTFAAYCYSRSAEERWLRSTPVRYPDVPGMPSVREINDFCSSEEWVDIYQEIRDQFVVPGSMKLKALAPVAGFSWRDPEPGGENSMAWYREAVGTSFGSAVSDAPSSGGREPVDRAMAERILRYNEDDVLATLALRQWMTDRAVEVPTVGQLDAD